MSAVLVPQSLVHDGPLTIFIGAHANVKSWNRKDLTWHQFLETLQIPKVTYETVEEYQLMDRTQRNKAKDVGGYVGGILEGNSRSKNSVVSRQLIALDLDDATNPEMLWEMFNLGYGCAAAVHSTHSHTPAHPKLRLLIPLSQSVSPKTYTKVSEHIASSLGISQFDKTTYEANRLMYWPSICKDGEYIFNFTDAPWLDVESILSELREDELTALATSRDPASLPGTEGKFCKKYTVQAAIEEFLPDVYQAVGEGDRYQFLGSHSTGGLVIYEGGNYAYSHHRKDPAEGKPRNAFELVRIHKFQNKIDENSGQITQVLSDDDSYKAMCTWIKENSICEVVEWLDELDVDKKGAPASTINNIRTIITKDPDVSEAYYYDEFADKVIVTADFPWLAYMDRTSIQWTDADDAGIRGFLENKYDIVDFGKTNDAFCLATVDKKIHPVKEYFKTLIWDGKPRADTLFVDFLNAEDTPYVRSVTRKSLIGAVARIFKPGCKHDHVLVLVGPQGCRKSQTIARLGLDWFSDSLATMQGKDAYELLQGKWLIELSEMAAAKKADLELIKSFLSKTSDNFRAAYARRPVDRPRQCAFFGTTNDAEFLRDPTGNRRFWPVKVSKVDQAKYKELNAEYIGQVWAEIIKAYNDNEIWYLDEVMEEKAKEVQMEHTVVDNRLGLIVEFLASLVPRNWNKMTQEERMLHYATGTIDEEDGIKRDRTCALELWVELFKGQVKDFTPAKAIELNNLLKRIPYFRPSSKVIVGWCGTQRGFIRE
jgi:predicted P-loop ATPase